MRAVYLSYETGVVRFPVDGRTGEIREGDAVCAYIAEDAPVYENEGIFWVRDHYALEVNGRK